MGVPQEALDRIAPGVKSQDVNNILGALDRAIPGLGNVVRKNAGSGLAAGVNSIGTAAVLEGKAARTFPLKFVDGAVFLGPLRVAQIPPLF
jgi:tetrahydromethanopterin S-methyltransferase subunit C